MHAMPFKLHTIAAEPAEQLTPGQPRKLCVWEGVVSLRRFLVNQNQNSWCDASVYNEKDVFNGPERGTVYTVNPHLPPPPSPPDRIHLAVHSIKILLQWSIGQILLSHLQMR